jgi:hypothetical protein
MIKYWISQPLPDAILALQDALVSIEKQSNSDGTSTQDVWDNDHVHESIDIAMGVSQYVNCI